MLCMLSKSTLACAPLWRRLLSTTDQSNLSQVPLFPPSTTLISRFDETEADAFYHALFTGANLEEDNPVYMLRDMLLKMAQGDQDYLVHGPGTLMCVKAWNLFARGEKCPSDTISLKRKDDAEAKSIEKPRGSFRERYPSMAGYTLK